MTRLERWSSREAKVRASVDTRLRFIMANREKLIRAFIAETGLLPSQCELVEYHEPFQTVVRVRKLGDR